MDFGLNNEQQMIVDTVRSFVENEIYPLEDEVERTGQVPREIGEEIKRKVLELGFFAPNMPADIGGGGLDQLEFALLDQETRDQFFGAAGCVFLSRRHKDDNKVSNVGVGDKVFCAVGNKVITVLTSKAFHAAHI